MKYRILLWGTGERAKRIIEKKYFQYCDIVGVIDTYRKNNYFMNYRVYLPEELKMIIEEVNYLIIANHYFLHNLEICMELGIGWDKIVITDNVQEPLFNKMFFKLRDLSSELYSYMKNMPKKIVQINESDSVDKNMILGKGKYNSPLYMRDYFRYRTFEFVAREILKKDVSGAVAEFGVFRGTFSSIINEIFREKKIYLFDTFEGFEGTEAEKEVSIGYCDEDFVAAHKDTSVERMIENLPYPENCIICKGFFPDSITEKAYKESYAFVSIDVDFEESSYEGLKFFYPRLSDGGVIFMHDYNTYFLDGVRCAINRFEDDYGIALKKIPLADRAGTLVIVK